MPHPDADKLVVLQVDFGDEKRQIVAGIKKHYPCTTEDDGGLSGLNIIVVMNLEPRALRGVMSHGMLLAASDGDNLTLLTVDESHAVKAGSKVG